MRLSPQVLAEVRGRWGRINCKSCFAPVRFESRGGSLIVTTEGTGPGPSAAALLSSSAPRVVEPEMPVALVQRRDALPLLKRKVVSHSETNGGSLSPYSIDGTETGTHCVEAPHRRASSNAPPPPPRPWELQMREGPPKGALSREAAAVEPLGAATVGSLGGASLLDGASSLGGASSGPASVAGPRRGTRFHIQSHQPALSVTPARSGNRRRLGAFMAVAGVAVGIFAFRVMRPVMHEGAQSSMVREVDADALHGSAYREDFAAAPAAPGPAAFIADGADDAAASPSSASPSSASPSSASPSSASPSSASPSSAKQGALPPRTDEARRLSKASGDPPEESGSLDASAGVAFDVQAASLALNAAQVLAAQCRQPGDPTGVARLAVTFAASGRVTSATISGPPFSGTETGSCIANRFRNARVPAFEGGHLTVTKTVSIQ